MGRRQNDPEHSRFASLVLLSVALFSCVLVYAVVSTLLSTNVAPQDSFLEPSEMVGSDDSGERKKHGCCGGIENLELWGPAVKWGSEFKFNSSVECCQACKTMCSGNDGPCLCDTWVFCGNKEACGSRFGEDAGKSVIWTSGLIFGKGEGIVGMETEYGTLHVKLFPDCAPYSVAYILELLTLRHCVGCQFYRAEGRGRSWDSEGNHIKDAPYGPPFALIQGILEAQGTPFEKMPTEACPTIRRGSVAWIGSGPEFFISLANHGEWKNSYPVFGSVLPEDMEIAERIVQLPTKSDVWNNVNVSVFEKPVPLIMRRMKKSLGDLNSNVKSE
ncbi:hypothetical protein V6N12_017624 [Hibiscus sabdariffa]|uniref:PPIase cyclophilin-type domain-containing protein n=1 Tax=Hibiscus sabdariffa TaxID=183260 RepID=A0ABR2CG29_9ROSI